jgi:hypothetical protein
VPGGRHGLQIRSRGCAIPVSACKAVRFVHDVQGSGADSHVPFMRTDVICPKFAPRSSEPSAVSRRCTQYFVIRTGVWFDTCLSHTTRCVAAPIACGFRWSLHHLGVLSIVIGCPLPTVEGSGTHGEREQQRKLGRWEET